MDDRKLGWTKYTGYPMWPCRVALESEASDQVKKQKKEGKNLLVYFFGSHDFAWVQENNFLDFDSNFEQYSKTKRKDFQTGIREAFHWRDSKDEDMSDAEDATDEEEEEEDGNPDESLDDIKVVVTKSKAASNSPKNGSTSPSTSTPPAATSTSTSNSPPSSSPKEDMRTTIITLPNFKKKVASPSTSSNTNSNSNKYSDDEEESSHSKSTAPATTTATRITRPFTARSKAMAANREAKEAKENATKAASSATTIKIKVPVSTKESTSTTNKKLKAKNDQIIRKKNFRLKIMRKLALCSPVDASTAPSTPTK